MGGPDSVQCDADLVSTIHGFGARLERIGSTASASL
jgi:hypothetical protein